MRIAELLHTNVVDCNGTVLGSVDDVRLVQDGPVLEGFGAALRIDGLVVGNGSLAIRLGYYRHKVQGPGLVKWLLERWEKRARYVSWEQVASYDENEIRLQVPVGETKSVAEQYQ